MRRYTAHRWMPFAMLAVLVGSSAPVQADALYFDVLKDAATVAKAVDDVAAGKFPRAVGAPPANEFLDFVTSLVYRKVGNELEPVGAGLPADGYEALTTAATFDAGQACDSTLPLGCNAQGG